MIKFSKSCTKKPSWCEPTTDVFLVACTCHGEVPAPFTVREGAYGPSYFDGYLFGVEEVGQDFFY